MKSESSMAAAASQSSGMVLALDCHWLANDVGTENGKSKAATAVLGRDASRVASSARGVRSQEIRVRTPSFNVPWVTQVFLSDLAPL